LPTIDENTDDEGSTNQKYKNNRIESQRYKIVWKGLKGLATIILFPLRLMDGILEFVFELIEALLEIASGCGCTILFIVLILFVLRRSVNYWGDCNYYE